MVHPNQSAGFFQRYSFFYIPLVYVVLPILYLEMQNIKSRLNVKSILISLAGAGVLCLFISFYTLLGNWTKATDNKFAEIWMEHQGWEDVTYLIGPAKYSFHYYISRTDGYQKEYVNNTKTNIDVNNLPKKFWLWKLSWGNTYELAIEQATKQGYIIEDYSNSLSSDKLTFCYLKDN